MASGKANSKAAFPPTGPPPMVATPTIVVLPRKSTVPAAFCITGEPRTCCANDDSGTSPLSKDAGPKSAAGATPPVEAPRVSGSPELVSPILLREVPTGAVYVPSALKEIPPGPQLGKHRLGSCASNKPQETNNKTHVSVKYFLAIAFSPVWMKIVYGEGRGLCFRHLPRPASRRSSPFRTANCSSRTRSLLQSDLPNGS